MVNTGGRLKPKLVELIGELNQAETLKNINRDIAEIEKKLKSQDKKIRMNVELFGNVKDIAKNVSDLQAKLDASPNFKDIKIGVSLDDINVKDINEQIEKVQRKFNEAKTADKLKLDVEFDFTGSASKIKEEMEGIRQFMERYGQQMKNMDLINLDKDADNVKKNTEGMKTGIQALGQGVDTVSNEIEADMRKMTTSSGKFGVTFERDVNGAIKGATGTLTNANGTIEKFKYNVDSTTGELVHMSRNTQVAGDQQERLEKAIKKTDDAQRKLNQALKTAPDNLPQELAETAQAHINTARAMAEHGEVTDKGMASLSKFDNALAELNETSKRLTIENEFKETQQATREMIQEFERMGSLAPEDARRFSSAVESAENNSTNSLKALQEEIKETATDFNQSTSEIERAMNRLSDAGRKEFTTAIKTGDINTVKRYVEELYGAEVASIKLTDRKNKLGQSVDRVTVGMKEANGAVDSYTLDLNRADNTLKEVNSTTKTLTDSNSRLDGGFKAVLSRITQYFGAIEILQRSMQSLRAIMREVMEIDAQRIELARVADPSLNLDVILERSVSMSKELGSSVKDVMESVAEMARTFGEFNEAQLLAITQTATIATNVSNLNMGEATSAIVASIQAFNIEAEDSIRIIDALNEVNFISLPAQKCA